MITFSYAHQIQSSGSFHFLISIVELLDDKVHCLLSLNVPALSAVVEYRICVILIFPSHTEAGCRKDPATSLDAKM